MNGKAISERLTAIIMTVIIVLTGSIVASTLNPDTAEAASLNKETLTPEMITGFSMQVKRAEPAGSDWEDLNDGDHVNVYDTVRYKVGFNIPRGTLSSNNKTLSAYVKMNGSADFPAYYCSPSQQYGNIIINGEESGTYSVRLMDGYYDYMNSYYSSCSGNAIDGMYQMRLRVVFTFNDDVIRKNQDIDISDGVLTFDQPAYYLADGGNEPSLSIGGSDKTTTIHLDKIHVNLSKEAVGESHYDDATGLVLQKFRVSVENDGDLDLPAGWQIGDSMYKGEAPSSFMSSAGYVPSSGFAYTPDSYTKAPTPEWAQFNYHYSHYTSYGYSYTVDRGRRYTTNLSRPTGYDYSSRYASYHWNYSQAEHWYSNRTLKAGQTMTYEYTAYTPYNESVDHWTNRVSLLPNTSYYPEILTADARMDKPKDYKHDTNPYLEYSKENTAQRTLDCRPGEPGCIEEITWTTTFKNTGDGDQVDAWEVVDQLNHDEHTMYGGAYTWFTRKNIENLLTAFKDAGLDAKIIQLAFDDTHNSTKKPDGGDDSSTGGDSSDSSNTARWETFTSLDDVNDRIEARDLVGYRIRVESVLKAGDSVKIPYQTTMEASWPYEGDSSSRTVGNGITLCDTFYDPETGERCGPVKWTTATRTLSAPSLYKACGTYDSLDSTKNNSHSIGRCNIRLTVPKIYQDETVLTFREKMTPKTITYSSDVYKGNKSPASFLLGGYPQLYTGSDPHYWTLESPKEIGETTTRTVDNDRTRVSITKDSDEDWTIQFEVLKQGGIYGDGQDYLNYYIYYREGDFPDDAYTVTDETTNARSIAMGNTVTATIGEGDKAFTTAARTSDWGQRYYQSTSVTKAAKSLASTTPSGASGSRVVYRTGFNPGADDLNADGTTIDFTDIMTGVPNGVSVSLDTSSVKVKASHQSNSSNLNHNFNGGSRQIYYPGNDYNYSSWDYYLRYSYRYLNSMSSTPPSNAYDVPITADQITYDPTTNTMKITGLPDDVRLWVEYAMMFNSNQKDSHDIRVQNSAKLTQEDGSTIDGMSTSTTNTVKIYHSSAVADITGVFFDKYDAGHLDQRVGNAVYQLEEWDGEKWVNTREVTTSGTGSAVIDKLTCGTAYRIHETQAPTNYLLDDAVYGFYLKECGTSSGLMPEGFDKDPSNKGMLILDHLMVTDHHAPTTDIPSTGSRDLLILLGGVGIVLIGVTIPLINRVRKNNEKSAMTTSTDK